MSDTKKSYRSSGQCTLNNVSQKKMCTYSQFAKQFNKSADYIDTSAVKLSMQ